MLEEGANPDDQELLNVVGASPENRQWDKGDNRHVADEVGEWLNRGLPRTVSADHHTDRDGENRCQREADRDSIAGDEDVVDQVAAGGQL